MAILKPFRGLRYNQEIIKDFSAVVTPPYDVISPSEQDRYYQIHPKNIIRLDFGKDLPGDNEEVNKYTRASKYLADWKKEGILKQEDAPAIYIYDQDYTHKGKRYTRRGFIALVKLEPFDKGSIYPHEQTLPGPKKDRLRLIQSCQANLSSIFALFPDETNEIDNFLNTLVSTPPEIDFTDCYDVENKLWVIQEKQVIDKLVSLMREKPLFIADGHHRYETSLAHSMQMHKEDGREGEELPSDYIMMVCVSLNNRGLQVLPTHRLVRNIKDFHIDTILSSLRKVFDVELFDDGNRLEKVFSWLERAEEGHCFGMYVGQEDAYYALSLTDTSVLDAVFDADHPEWKNLDAGILHGMVIKKVLGLDAEDAALKEYVKYVKDETEAVSLVKSGQYQLAFFLRPTPVRQVREIASERKVMPPKSTYFHPKLITGIVINSFDGQGKNP